MIAEQCLTVGVITAPWQEVWNFLRWGNPFALLFSVILGACLGSFANVVIHRLPRNQSIVIPASYCPYCRVPIPPKHNIPILSYFFLRGRTACCNRPIPARYPIVEALAALFLGTLYIFEGWTVTFLFESAWMLLLLILAAIDLEHFRLPNVLVGMGAVLSLVWMLLQPSQSWSHAGLGLLLGFGIAGATMVLGKLLKGRWSGMGDLKLAAVLGFTFGPGRFLILYLVATFSAVIYAAARRKSAEIGKIPMGPFFALGAWVAILCGEEVVLWYLSMIV